MNDSEAIAVLEVLAGADQLADWGASILLTQLQVKLPDRDWFYLAVDEIPTLGVWDPHDHRAYDSGH